MAGSRPLDLEELMILTSIEPTTRGRCLILLLAGSGLRIGELRSARVGSVMTAQGALSGRIHIPQKATKRQVAARLLVLPQATVDALGEWLKDHPNAERDAPLFPSSHEPTEPLTARQIQRIITGAARRAGLTGKVTAHSFRKYFARTMHRAMGNDISKTARALNHKNVQSTMYYLDDAAAEIESAALAVLPEMRQIS